MSKEIYVMKATISQRGFGFVTDNMSLGLTVPYLNISCKNGDMVTVSTYRDFVKKLSEDTVDTFFGKGKQHVFLAERDGHGFEWSVTEVEDGLMTDFYGNEITSTNIGCYSADGEDAELETENFIEKAARIIRQVFKIAVEEIRKLIVDLFDD